MILYITATAHKTLYIASKVSKEIAATIWNAGVDATSDAINNVIDGYK